MASSSSSTSDFFNNKRPELSRLLTSLHAQSLAQEEQEQKASNPMYPVEGESLNAIRFNDKLVALEKDKAQALYLILRSSNAQRIFEAGTSFGVSTMYLITAMRDNFKQNGPLGNDEVHAAKVWGTEMEEAKAQIAMRNFQQAFSANDEWAEIKASKQVEILLGDILRTVPQLNLQPNSIDALLLDIWAPLALPTLKNLEHALRPGATLFIDNSTSGANRYADLLTYLDRHDSGWRRIALPFHNGFELAVKC